jgi:hypothetical protein
MGWNDHSDKWIEMNEQATQLAETYTEITGTIIQADVDNNLEEFWISSNRTNGREYFYSIEEADRRLRQLYSDLLADDGDYSDPYEGYW